MREETRKWIAKADKDLGTAGFALNSVDGPLPLTTGMHCQLSAEKYLKAYLHEHDLAFSSQQTLTSLLEDCIAADESFEALHSDIDQLEGYSIASRYPRADDSLAFRKEAVATVERVKEFVLSRLDAK
jgi:HEPN domain-containing protein